MWSLKSIIVTPESNSTQFTASITLQAENEEDVVLSSRLSSRSELEETIKLNINRLNDRSALIAETSRGSFTLTPAPQPQAETAKQRAEREYAEALALYKDLQDKAAIDPTTFNWGRDNQRVIVQQKLQALTALS